MPLTLVFVVLALLSGGAAPKSDEAVTFFPTYATLSSDAKTWNARIRGWIYEPEEKSLKRQFALGLFRRFLGMPEHGEETDLFRSRARMFLVDNEDDRRISVRIGSATYPAGTSGDDGHFGTAITIPAGGLSPADRVQRFAAVTAPDDNRTFAGEFYLISPTGDSVISDIDDTIKITNVRNKKTLMANTFLLPYKPVPGMAEVYRGWAARGRVFHYVSGSPWQLYPSLADFLRANRFPAGTVHLRNFRWLDSSVLEIFSPPEQMKLRTIAAILDDFPGRRFILVGDTGERDPEVYGHFARRRPGQIRHIYLRNVTNESPDSERFRKAFDNVSREKWTLFTDPLQIGQTESVSSFRTMSFAASGRASRRVFACIRRNRSGSSSN